MKGEYQLKFLFSHILVMPQAGEKNSHRNLSNFFSIQLSEIIFV